MKKILGLLVAVVLTAGLSACGVVGPQASADTTTGTSSVVEAKTFQPQRPCRWHTNCVV